MSTVRTDRPLDDAARAEVNATERRDATQRRLAEALRENLRRRKAQLRGRKEMSAPAGSPPSEEPS